MSDKPYYTVAQLAERLQIGVHRVLNLIHGGKLRAINISTGRRPTWRIPIDAVVAWEAASSTRPAAAKPGRRRRDPEVIEFF